MKNTNCQIPRIFLLSLALALLVAVPSSARAVVLAGSYDGVHNDGCADFAVGNFSGYNWALGARFTVAGYGEFGLRKMTLRVRNYASSANPDNYKLSIVRDNRGRPDGGQVVWSGSPQGIGPVADNYCLTLRGAVQGGQDYWLLFEPVALDGGRYWWAYSTSPILNCGQGGNRDTGGLARRWSTNGLPTLPWNVWNNEIRPAFLIEGSRLPQAVIVISPLSDCLSLIKSVVLAPNNSGATVMLNGSFSTGSDDNPLEYTWLDGTNLLATTTITTNCLEVGTHQITLVVSDGIDSATASAVLDILTPGDAVHMLICLVEQAEFGGKNKRPLIAILSEAAHSFDRDGMRAGLNQLRTFQNKVRSQIARVDYEMADWLIAIAQEIKDAVTGPGTH